MKVSKHAFDDTLKKLLKAKPEPRREIKTEGKKGSKKAIIQPSEIASRTNQ
jgi:hypothetical protein